MTSHKAISKVTGAVCAIWGIACCFCIIAARPHLSAAHTKLIWLYLQPVLPPVLMLWLWALNVRHFELRHIDYGACFAQQDRKALLSAAELYKVAGLATVLCLTALAGCMLLCMHGSATAPLHISVLLYTVMLLVLVLPVNMLHLRTRQFASCTLRRVLLPFQRVSWADFLLADMMTSLAKSIMDLDRSVCHMLQGPLAHRHVLAGALHHASCGPLAWHALGALCLPFLIRLVQCLLVFQQTRAQSQLFNAAKYACSLPALVLTAIEHEHHVHHTAFPLQRLWLGVMVVSSVFSYYWDVRHDWAMNIWQPGAYERLQSAATTSPGRPGLHPGVWCTWLLASNLALRLSWMHRLFGDLEAHNEVLMAVALLEVVRRWQWVYGRVDTELRQLHIDGSNGAVIGAPPPLKAKLSDADLLRPELLRRAAMHDYGHIADESSPVKALLARVAKAVSPRVAPDRPAQLLSVSSQ